MRPSLPMRPFTPSDTPVVSAPPETHPHPQRQLRLRLRSRRLGSLLLATWGIATPLSVQAELRTVNVTFTSNAGIPSTIPSVTASARLDFTLNIEKLLFLRVGAGSAHSGGASGTGPAANAAVTQISLGMTPSIPSGGAIPMPGNNQSVSWSGGLPGFSASSPVVVPVEVRSNAGPISISGQVTAPLTSGSNTIPMSSVTIASSDPTHLPAPALPNTGTGTPVNVSTGGTGTSAAPALLTYRTADWSFGFTPSATLAPGTYSGSVTFTATSL